MRIIYTTDRSVVLITLCWMSTTLYSWSVVLIQHSVIRLDALHILLARSAPREQAAH